MVQQTPVKDRLREYSGELSDIEPIWSNWPRIENWMASILPYLRRHFPNDLADFRKLAREPDWYAVPYSLGPTSRENEARYESEQMAYNNDRTHETWSKLRSFLDGLLRVDEALPEFVAPMPCRPYRRFQSQVMKPEEFHTHLIKGFRDKMKSKSVKP